MSKNPENMTPEELVVESARLRAVIVTASSQLQVINQSLNTKVRRAPSDEITSSYLHVASAGTRLAGMVLQAAKRTERLDRLLEVAKDQAELALKRALSEKQDQDRREVRKQSEEARDIARRARILGHDGPLSTAQDDLNQLYGEGN